MELSKDQIINTCRATIDIVRSKHITPVQAELAGSRCAETRCGGNLKCGVFQDYQDTIQDISL